MGTRALAVAVAVGIALVPGAASGASDTTTTVCTWGGTPAVTTGILEIKPGLTMTPASEDLKFVATGELAGGPGCSGTVTFDGIIGAGSTCAWQTFFSGKVKGLPGVDSFWGPGGGGFVAETLYDSAGNVVGTDQAQVLSGAGQGQELTDCNTEDGFTRGVFSSLIELYR